MLPEGWKIGKVSTVIKDLESGVSVNGEDRTFDKDEKAVLKVSAVTYGKFNPNAAKVINLQYVICIINRNNWVLLIYKGHKS